MVIVMNNEKLIERYRGLVDEISKNYDYDSNIKHLLYIIIPSFVKKYGLNRENIIVNTFRNVKIFISNVKNNIINACYLGIPRYDNDKIVVDKVIIINNYEKISLVDLLDSLVHEFNHAINSYNNYIRWDNERVYLRTGLSWVIYEKESLKSIEKDLSYVMEEIINTKQTEDIINIIKNFTNVDNNVSNTIYSINNETNSIYNSKAYYLESYICKKILENRTFISTMESLRISGEVNDIGGWFDNIVGYNGSYESFISYLEKILTIELELKKAKYFKVFKIKKLKELSKKLMEIVNTFNNNCHYS